MAIGAITRRKATITVTVANRPRRFLLRAHSVAEHLELLELQENARLQALAEAKVAGDSQAVAARAGLTATLAVVTHLLQEPADRGHDLTEEESWSLALGDPGRVLSLQSQLTDVQRVLSHVENSQETPTLADVAGRWLDVSSTIAQARLAPDAQTPLTIWSVEQLVETYHRACAVLWREDALKIRLAGGDPGNEPDFRRGGAAGVDSAPFTADDEECYAKWKAEFEAQLNSGSSPVFPGQMGRVAKQALADAHYDHMKAGYRAANRDPDGRKFPGTL